MESVTYHVQADWDPDAGGWVATSADVPGLATEAETIEDLTNRLRTMIPELLEANGLLAGDVPSDSIAFEPTSHRQELVTLHRTPLPNEGLVDWLLACPEKDFFVPIESESTDPFNR
jgi:predicted RNase H-like HicB family nuclease